MLLIRPYLAGCLITLFLLAVSGPLSLAASQVKTLSVFPFEDLAGKDATARLVRRLPAELLLKLQRANPSLKLISRDPEVMDKIVKEMGLAMNGMLDPKHAPAIGKQYGVQTLVKGTVDQQGEKYRCIFQIIDTTTAVMKTGEAWSPDIESLPDRITEEVLRLLGMPVTDMQKIALQSPALRQFSIAFDLEQRGDLTGAMAAYREAIRLDAHFPEAWNNLAGIHRRQGQADDAMQAYRKALASGPDLAIVHANLGNLYFDSNRYDEAMKEYLQALELDGGLARVHYNVACIHALRGRNRQALEALEQALRLFPDLKQQARRDADLSGLLHEERFQQLTAQ